MTEVESIHETYDVVYDKATFDAISLGEDKSKMEKYMVGLMRMLKESENSILVVSSINFAFKELIYLFETVSLSRDKVTNARFAEGKTIKHYKIMKYPEMKFGGSSGSIASTVAFKWVDM